MSLGHNEGKENNPLYKQSTWANALRLVLLLIITDAYTSISLLHTAVSDNLHAVITNYIAILCCSHGH